MVLEKYESPDVSQYRKRDGLVGMSAALANRFIIKSMVKQGILGLDDENTNRELENVITDYRGFRDVAIKRGVDVSEWPKTLKRKF